VKKFWLVILITSALLTQCNKNKSNIIISGFLFKTTDYFGDSSYSRDITVYNNNGFSMIPVTTINNETLGIYDYNINWYEYADEKIIPISQDYELEVKHADGTAKSKIAMPGNFRITMPDTSFVLPRDSALVIGWTKSEKATWYWLDFYITYEYEDTTTGETDYYDFWKDTVITDTFVRLQPNRFFPFDSLNIILEGEGEANVWAMDGPKIIPGSEGNISGDGIGFFHAANEQPDAYFYVGARPSVRHLYLKELSREKLRNKLKSLVPIP